MILRELLTFGILLVSITFEARGMPFRNDSGFSWFTLTCKGLNEEVGSEKCTNFEFGHGNDQLNQIAVENPGAKMKPKAFTEFDSENSFRELLTEAERLEKLELYQDLKLIIHGYETSCPNEKIEESIEFLSKSTRGQHILATLLENSLRWRSVFSKDFLKNADNEDSYKRYMNSMQKMWTVAPRIEILIQLIKSTNDASAKIKWAEALSQLDLTDDSSTEARNILKSIVNDSRASKQTVSYLISQDIQYRLDHPTEYLWVKSISIEQWIESKAFPTYFQALRSAGVAPSEELFRTILKLKEVLPQENQKDVIYGKIILEPINLK